MPGTAQATLEPIGKGRTVRIAHRCDPLKQQFLPDRLPLGELGLLSLDQRRNRIGIVGPRPQRCQHLCEMRSNRIAVGPQIARPAK